MVKKQKEFLFLLLGLVDRITYHLRPEMITTMKSPRQLQEEKLLLIELQLKDHNLTSACMFNYINTELFLIAPTGFLPPAGSWVRPRVCLIVYHTATDSLSWTSITNREVIQSETNITFLVISVTLYIQLPGGNSDQHKRVSSYPVTKKYKPAYSEPHP